MIKLIQQQQQQKQQQIDIKNKLITNMICIKCHSVRECRGTILSVIINYYIKAAYKK